MFHKWVEWFWDKGPWYDKEDFLITLKHPSSWWGIWHVRVFFECLSRVLAYVPVLWSNHDFDHGYILRLLRYKIKRTRDHIMHHKMHTEWRRDVWHMNYAILLLDRIMADDYFIDEWVKHFEKWPSIMQTDEQGRCFSPSMPDDERAEWEPLHKKTEDAKTKDWHNLWKFLDEHLREWWD
jgi:hypothetical protein